MIIHTSSCLLHVVLLVTHVRQVLNVWLQLLEEDEAKGNKSLMLDILYVFSFLNSINEDLSVAGVANRVKQGKSPYKIQI